MSDETQKVSNHIFSWFKKKKVSDELSVQTILHQFEQNNSKQQLRIDEMTTAHLSDLKQSHKEQLLQKDEFISQLRNELDYHKNQQQLKQNAVEQIYTRYDSLMGYLISKTTSKSNVKEIFLENDFIQEKHDNILANNSVKNGVNHYVNSKVVDETSSTSSRSAVSSNNDELKNNLDERTHGVNVNNTSTKNIKVDEEIRISESANDTLFEQAISKRSSGDKVGAFVLFEQAAEQGHCKSMGAMGRSFFLGEGTDENHLLGLFWLIKAADKKLPQAIDRVKYFKENEPELYHEAIEFTKQQG